jgi:hypothetical protein
MPINRHHNYAQNDRRPSRPQFLQVPGGDGFSSSFQQQNNEIDEKLPSRSRSLGCNNYDSQFGGGFELQTMGFKRPMPAMSSTSHQSVLSSSSSWKVGIFSILFIYIRTNSHTQSSAELYVYGFN